MLAVVLRWTALSSLSLTPFHMPVKQFHTATNTTTTGGILLLHEARACGSLPQAPGSSAGRASKVNYSSEIEKQRIIATLETSKSFELQFGPAGLADHS